jgi:hypothetical protein
MQPGRAITRKGRMDRDCLGARPAVPVVDSLS